MPTLIVSPRAEEDLEEIYTFAAGHDPRAADRLIEVITNRFDYLLTYPMAGRARHDLLVNLRSLPVKNHIIFYQPIDDGIEILRVLHGLRDVQRVFNEMVEDAD